MTKTRTFEDTEAKRERVPLMVGLVGASGSGKTYSALRLATGMQQVTGGDIYVIDTESRRSLHYADRFKFRHVEMKAPFSPLDYLAAIEYCVSKKAGVIVVDSMSHEHEGPGGVLEMHEAELERMAGSDFKKRERVKFAAWAKPKQQRRRLINSILQLGANAIFCFRAKEKLKLEKGKDPVDQGWMPIAGEEFIYEQTINFLLYPSSGGVPTWKPDKPGERVMLKLPVQLAPIFEKGGPIDENAGKALADWAAGDEPEIAEPSIPFPDFLRSLSEAPDRDALDRAMAFGKDEPWTEAQRAEIRAAIQQRRAELDAAPDPEPTDDAEPEGW